MENGNNKNQKKYRTKILLVIVIVVLFGVGYWYVLQQINNAYPMASNNVPVINNSTKQDKSLSQVKTEILMVLRELSVTGKYGQWPITETPLSPARGNPFVKVINKVVPF